MSAAQLLLLILQFGAVIALRCACNSKSCTKSTCKVRKGGHCYVRYTLQDEGLLNETYTTERGCISRGSSSCSSQRTTGDHEVTYCCKGSNFCNQKETETIPTERTTSSPVATERRPGLLTCSCNTCESKRVCTVDTRNGGKCLADIGQELNGRRWPTLGCAEQSQWQCQQPALCCSDKDECNQGLLIKAMDALSASTSDVPVPNVDEPTFNIRKLAEPDTNSNEAKASADPLLDQFECHCSNCSDLSCRTSDYCVAAFMDHHIEYGCVDSNNILIVACQSTMPNIYCCKGNNCNRNGRLQFSPRVLPTTKIERTSEPVINTNTNTPQPASCESSLSANKNSDELKDSEYVVILVCVTVPSFFIFLALAAIFCYTVRKYHRQSDARRTSISPQTNGRSRVTNGKAYIGAQADDHSF